MECKKCLMSLQMFLGIICKVYIVLVHNWKYFQLKNQWTYMCNGRGLAEFCVHETEGNWLPFVQLIINFKLILHHLSIFETDAVCHTFSTVEEVETRFLMKFLSLLFGSLQNCIVLHLNSLQALGYISYR